MTNMNGLKRKEQTIEIWTHLLQNNMSQVKTLVELYGEDQGRALLLGEILQGLKYGTQEEVLQQIYLYGSMIKPRDFLARQFFLWLLEMTEHHR